MKTVRHMPAMLAITLLGTLVAESASACKVPTAPKSIPDGRKAGMEVMLETKRKVEQYLQEVSAYVSCEKNGLKLQEVVATEKFVTDRFSAEVRAFNAQARAIKAVNRE